LRSTTAFWNVFLLIAVLASCPVEARDALYSRIEGGAARVEPDVIGWRRDIHQHPELANRETRTAKLVADHLRALGLRVTTGVARTGVVAVLDGAKPGPVIALRADMDALPVAERTGLSFASQVRSEYEGRDVPVMHACGHDAHVAILLGTASVLTSLRQELAGTVKFIFQPAEEGAPRGEEGGAALMIREGVLRDPDVEAIFGLHVGQQGPAGTATWRARGAMASAQRFDITITGKQTHGARPWEGVDPIVVGAQIVTALQTIVSRGVDITSAPAVVTVGTFESGVRNNIIPDEAVLSGTIRTFDPEVQGRIHHRMREMITGIARSMGAQAGLEIEKGVPVTWNDVELVQRMLPTLQRAYGPARVFPAPMNTGAEDFAHYQQEIPGFFFFIGARPASTPPQNAVPNHSPFFDVDETALRPAVVAMSQLAVDYLAGVD
jgi:amidohydrolase